MARPPNIIRPTQLELKLPEDLRGWLDVHLWSDSQQRVPQGAYKNLFVKLLLEYKEKVERQSDSIA